MEKSAQRIGQKFLAGFLAAAIVWLCLVTPARAENIPVVVSSSAGTARAVFQFPKLTAYYDRSSETEIFVRFDTKNDISIEGFSVTRAGDGMVEIRKPLAKGGSHKIYRQKRWIVLETSGEPEAQKPVEKKPEAPKVAETKPEPKPEEIKKDPAPAVTAPAIDASVAAAAEKAPEAKPAEETPVIEPVAQTVTETAAVEEPRAEKPLTEEPAVEEPLSDVTTITLSMIEPSPIAVFTRSSKLWVVVETTTASVEEPIITGPDMTTLGIPKTLKFENGIAYRFNMPEKLEISAARENLNWRISLSKNEKQPPAKARLSVNVDEATGKAKLLVNLQSSGHVISFGDPGVGDRLYVVPSDDQEQRLAETRKFPDVEFLPAIVGLALRPVSDSLKVGKLDNTVIITSPEGMIVTPDADRRPRLVNKSASEDMARLFDFPNWRRGGLPKFFDNRRKIEDQIAETTSPQERSGLLMKLALLYFANNFGQEALGVLRIIEEESPDVVKNPNFIAIRGAARAMAGQFDDALKDLSYPAIQQHPEVSLWRGYAAAATEQWVMANRSFPKDNGLLVEYPDNLAVPFMVYMAESALRLGNTDSAKELLQALNTNATELDDHHKAAVKYLRGETARQQGDIETAMKLWKEVAGGIDRLYHSKAALSLTNLELHEKKLTPKEAIDKVDSLRFAWRGDGLETQILKNFGDLKIQNKQYLEGLQALRDAVTLQDNMLQDSTAIREDMAKTFADLFIRGKAKDIAPLEAVAVYNEFNKFLPEDETASIAILNFADHLIGMDLLDKAIEIYKQQMQAGLPPEKTADIGTKMIALYLLDGRPLEALEAVNVYDRSVLPEKERTARLLLKARAQSQLNMTSEAIDTLSALGTKEAQHLKADVYWRAGNWPQAGDAIDALLPDPAGKISAEDAQLVLNAAVARKLGGENAKLDALRQKYATAMRATALGDAFGVVSRSGGASTLADRETMMDVASEVDMFKGFLEGYKSAATPPPLPGG